MVWDGLGWFWGAGFRIALPMLGPFPIGFFAMSKAAYSPEDGPEDKARRARGHRQVMFWGGGGWG